MKCLPQPPFNPSHPSQTRVALGQSAIFNPSQVTPVVTGQKAPETRVALALVTGVTGPEGGYGDIYRKRGDYDRPV
jgi:hypothetical protein